MDSNKKDKMKVFVENLDRIRKQKNMSVDALARKANISVSTLNSVRHLLSSDIKLLATALPLAEALECGVDALINGVNSPD